MNHTREQRLLDGLRRQREIYTVLARLTRRQSEVLTAGRSEEMLELARSKQHELDRIEEINADIGPLKETWREWREVVAAEPRAAVEQELEALRRTLSELLEIEEQQEHRVRDQRDQVAGELRQSEGQRRVQSAYGRTAQPGRPRLIDRSR